MQNGAGTLFFWALAYRAVIKNISDLCRGSTSPGLLEWKDERNEGQKGTQAKTYIKYKIVRALGVGEWKIPGLDEEMKKEG